MWLLGPIVELVLAAIVDFILYFLIWTIGYAVARVLLPLIFCRKIDVAPPEFFGKNYGLLGFRYNNIGRLEIGPETAGFIGFMMFCAVLLAAIFAAHFLSTEVSS